MNIFNHHVFGCRASIKSFIRRFCIVDAQPELQCCVAHWALWDQEGGQSAVKMVMKVQFKGFRIQGRWDIKVVRNVCARKPFPDIASSFLFAFSQERSVVIPPSDTFSNFDKNFQLLSPHLIFSQKLSVVIPLSDLFPNVHKKLSVIIPPSDTFSVVIPHLIFSQKHSVVIAPSDTFSNIEVCLKASYAFFKIQNNAETKLYFHWER